MIGDMACALCAFRHSNAPARAAGGVVSNIRAQLDLKTSDDDTSEVALAQAAL
jgi:hypothetical protein